MNFTFFNSLSLQQSQEFLEQYLSVENKSILDMIPMLESEKVSYDYSIDSIPGFLKWILKRIQSLPSKVDDNIPVWIRETRSYENSLIEFDEHSKYYVLHASYYLGESFVREKALSWSIGRADSMVYNMPVITGFLHEMEMAPIMVVENLYLRILGDGVSHTALDKSIDYWRKLIP